MKFHNRKIQTEHDGHQWLATFDDYDGGMIDNETMSQDAIGTGANEIDAILDLLEQETKEFTDRQMVQDAIEARIEAVEDLLKLFDNMKDKELITHYQGQKIALRTIERVIGRIK